MAMTVHAEVAKNIVTTYLATEMGSRQATQEDADQTGQWIGTLYTVVLAAVRKANAEQREPLKSV